MTALHKCRSRQEGFTSLELMIVVAIVGILGALGVTNFGIWKARADLKAAVKTIQHELAVARMMAMSRNLTVTSTIAIAPAVVTVTTFNTNTGAVLASANHTYTHVNSLFAQLTVGPPPTWGSVPTTNVTFNSMGFRVGGTVPGSQNQVIAVDNDLTPNPLRYTIQVTQRGSVTWCGSDFCQGTH
ncbi:MAG: prepilin-type N-terminal cleavage/methylation domain-containing protein [Nitrospira sp.]